jgi:3-deoxy-7-phosphoheptulonate synthase
VSAVPAVQHISHLPIICDPSHASGKRDKVLSLARASIAAGADGLMVEVHDHPNQALSDGAQAILPDELDRLMEQTRALAPVVERTLPVATAAAR